MTIITKASAKLYFLTGAFPTQNQFGDTIDTYLGLGESGSQTVQGAVAFQTGITVSGDVSMPTGRITASAATFTGKLSGQTGAFSSLVSAKGGLNTTTVSAVSVNATGDILAATGKVAASAATINNLLTGGTATFSGIVSAATVDTNNLILSGTSIVSAKGNAAVVATVSGAVTNAHLAVWDATGNLTDGGATPTLIMTALGVGSIVIAYGVSTTAGSTTAGSNLTTTSLGSWGGTLNVANSTVGGNSLTGTWQALQTSGSVNNSILWQRTA